MIWVLGFIIGICLGSLTKVMADRSLTNKTFWGRSYCENCKKQLAWYDLFPILSYLFLKGQCRYCRKKLSLQYPMIEVLMGFLISGIFLKFVPAGFFSLSPEQQILVFLTVLFYSVVSVILASVFLTDLKTGYIPDRITFPGIWLIFILLIISSAAKIYFLYQSLGASTLGKYLLPPHSNYFYEHSLRISEPVTNGAIMALALGVFFYLLIVFTKGKGMGGGDLKLAVFLGLVFGFPYSLVVLILSFLLGSVVGIGLIFVGKKKFGQTIPFGPFLSLAGMICIFWGPEILSWYLSLKIV